MNDRLERVASAILDGTPVDWRDASDALGDTDPLLLDQLKALESISAAVRRIDIPSGALEPKWNHLQLFERIGRGAFGDVYRARDPRLDRDVALKLLPSLGLDDDEIGTTVIDEGRLLAKIRHPNVVTIYGAERVDGYVGLWMELVEGRTLEEALADGATFSPREVVGIGRELASAVAAVHAAGLLHRDIKAQNVMRSNDGRLVLMDFGTGRELDAATGSQNSGTPLYLAPEVLDGQPASVRSDVYSIGVLLYRLLTSTYPVRGQDLADLKRAHARRTRDDLSDVRTRIPARFRRVLARALDPDASRRFASADALGEALAAVDTPIWRRPAVLAAAATLFVALGATAWVERGALAVWATGRGVGATTNAPDVAVAVLPFKNLSAEADSDFFVDGLTTEVIRNLAGIDGLQVRSQTSSFFFKGRARDLQAIGAQLRVDFVVEADVMRVGDRLRINAQLVNVVDDAPLWSEQFDRTVHDVFTVQDEISRAIVDRLRLSIGVGRRRYQTNLPAYEAYLRARVIVDRGGTNSGRTAVRLFEQVIAMDPTFAPAHAGLADAYAAMSWQLTGLTNADGLEGMRPAAERALALDPMLAEAHAAMGIVWSREQEWARSEASFTRALELDPGLTHIVTDYAFAALEPTGQLDKARALVTDAVTRDPLSPSLERELGWIAYMAGRYDDAIAHFQRVISVDPGLFATHQGLARALTFAGRPEDAINVWRGKPASDGDWERWITTAYVRAGRTADVERMLEAHRDEHPYRQALVYAAIGDRERTLEALTRAVPLAPHRTALLLGFPEMAFLRGDERLAALRARLNLP